jgi:hypothetical protein
MQHEQDLGLKQKQRNILGRTKTIRKRIKKNDRRAHKAYLQGKKEGYAAHTL